MNRIMQGIITLTIGAVGAVAISGTIVLPGATASIAPAVDSPFASVAWESHNYQQPSVGEFTLHGGKASVGESKMTLERVAYGNLSSGEETAAVLIQRDDASGPHQDVHLFRHFVAPNGMRVVAEYAPAGALPFSAQMTSVSKFDIDDSQHVLLNGITEVGVTNVILTQVGRSVLLSPVHLR